MLKDFLFHHIGFAVKNIEKTAKIYIEQDWDMSNPVIDTTQNVRIAFLKKKNMPLYELVEPIDEKSPVVKTLNKNGVAPYHICYQVDDIMKAIKELRQNRFIPLFKPVPAPAINNKRICYLFNAEIGLIEIVEK